MAKNKDGQKKAAKGDKKAAKRSARKAHEPKIKGSKSFRHCTPIAKKMRAEAAFQAAHKGDKWLHAEMHGSRPAKAQAKAQPDLKFVEGQEKPIAASASLYAELAQAWGAD